MMTGVTSPGMSKIKFGAGNWGQQGTDTGTGLIVR
jgi:hypothetical protein